MFRMKGCSVKRFDEVDFPNIPGHVPVRVNNPEDLERYSTGFSNPYLLRLYEQENVEFDAPEDGHSVPFFPYNQVPQFELAPREYTFYISGLNSYRRTDISNHDEDSEFWEIP